jgi:peptide/nickel transport system substrate-binding protein
VETFEGALGTNRAKKYQSKSWRAGVAILVSASMVFAVSTAATSHAAGEPTGRLIIANAEPISAAYYDPASAFGLVDAQLASLVFDSVLTMDKNGKIGLGLASSYKVVSSTEVDLVIRSGVKFQDGSALTPDDVAGSINRLFDPKSKLAFALMGAPGLATVSGDTVKVVTDKPFGPLLHSLAVIAILPMKDINSPDNWKIKPTGTGPYSFVSNANNDITVTANATYWGVKPHIKTIILRYIEDSQARQSALVTGQVDISTRVGPVELAGVKRNKNFNVVTKAGPPSQIIQLWRDNGPLKNVKVRQALEFAIDRSAIAKTIQGGMNPIAYNGMPTNMPFYKAASERYRYNPTKAKALLKSAGYSGNLTLTMSTSTLVPKQAEIDQAIIGYLSAIGVKVKVTKLEVGKFRTTYGDYDMSLNTIATFNDDPSFSLGLYGGGIGKAIFGWTNPTYDALFAAQRDVTGPARAAAVNAAQTYLWKNARTLWLSDENWVYIVNKRVSGYQRAPLVGEPLITTASVK